MATLVVYKADPYADHTFKTISCSSPLHNSFFIPRYTMEKTQASPSPEAEDNSPRVSPSTCRGQECVYQRQHLDPDVLYESPQDLHDNLAPQSHPGMINMDDMYVLGSANVSDTNNVAYMGHMAPFDPSRSAPFRQAFTRYSVSLPARYLSLQQYPQSADNFIDHLQQQHQQHQQHQQAYLEPPASSHQLLTASWAAAPMDPDCLGHKEQQQGVAHHHHQFHAVHHVPVSLHLQEETLSDPEDHDSQLSFAHHAVPPPTICDNQDAALTSAEPFRRSSLYAPAVLPDVIRFDPQQLHHQQEDPSAHGPPTTTASFALVNASSTPAWTSAASQDSPTSTVYLEPASQARADTVDPATLTRRSPGTSAAGTNRHIGTHKVSKERAPSRTTQNPLARTLPTWLDSHREVLTEPHPAAQPGLSLMLHVPEADEMLPSTAPVSLAAETSSFRSTTPHQPLDIDGLHPGMRVVPSGEEVGIAPSMIFGSQSQERLASPENVDVTPPFMGEQFEVGSIQSNDSDHGTSFLARETSSGFLDISDSSNGNSRSSSRQSVASARASPLPGQHAESIPAAPKQPRVKLPRPSPTPMFLASEAAWESGEEEAEDGEQAEESSSQHGLPEVERQVTGVSTVGTDSEALRRQQAERSRQDAFLVAQRRAGLTYREIRRLGGFEEAESTLRGRFRTLTKPKEERVRRPRWSEGDDQLLVSAVRRLARGGLPAVGDDAPLRISWKAVSDFIAEHGGSYKFGNTTCHKRWTHLRSKGLV